MTCAWCGRESTCQPLDETGTVRQPDDSDLIARLTEAGWWAYPSGFDPCQVIAICPACLIKQHASPDMGVPIVRLKETANEEAC